uniref:NELL2-interacting cell ontogeny regulator 1 n=2 Tax=Taeniopygia guttata TaxID=59729 RepID=A0A674GAQ3_TAEGU
MLEGRMLAGAAGALPAPYSCSKGLAQSEDKDQVGLELLTRAMALPSWSEARVAMLLLSALSLLSARLVGAGQDPGSAIPAESRPCVDCHAFEFMQRALQDLKRTARGLDTRTETLLLRAEKRGLCDCFHAIH